MGIITGNECNDQRKGWGKRKVYKKRPEESYGRKLLIVKEQMSAKKDERPRSNLQNVYQYFWSEGVSFTYRNIHKKEEGKGELFCRRFCLSDLRKR